MITNIVVYTDLGCDINLRTLSSRFVKIVYNPNIFSGAQWKHRKIGGHCMLFRNGKMIVNGKSHTVKEAKRRVRRYARILQKMGWFVQLKRIDVQTISASFKVEGPVNVPKIITYYRGIYEPDHFPAAMFVKDSVHFTCFHSGTVLMTGINDICSTFVCLYLLN